MPGAGHGVAYTHKPRGGECLEHRPIRGRKPGAPPNQGRGWVPSQHSQPSQPSQPAQASLSAHLGAPAHLRGADPGVRCLWLSPAQIAGPREDALDTQDLGGDGECAGRGQRRKGLIRTAWELRQARVFRARSPGFRPESPPRPRGGVPASCLSRPLVGGGGVPT